MPVNTRSQDDEEPQAKEAPLTIRPPTEFSYVRMHQAEDALRLGLIPHGGLIGTPYEFDSIIMEWICTCPNPLAPRS